jgi:hypothetical protein
MVANPEKMSLPVYSWFPSGVVEKRLIIVAALRTHLRPLPRVGISEKCSWVNVLFNGNSGL